MERTMLWHDRNPARTQAQRIERAAAYFTDTYGYRPYLCLVHESALADGAIEVDGIEVRADKAVIESHYWLKGEE